MSQTERIYFIHSSIKRKGNVNVREISEKFEIDPRTAKRDIQYMRERMGAPLVYDQKLRFYNYSKSYNLLDFADERMLLFYVFISGMAKSLSYIPMVTAELMETISDRISTDYISLKGRVSYHHAELEPIDNTVLKGVLTSMLERHVLHINYTDGAGNRKRRKLEPLHLMNYSGKWYLIAFCRESDRMKTFLISRIRDYDMLPENFSNNLQASEIENFVNNGFGIFKTEKTETVTICFYPPVYHIVKNQIWHPDQQRRDVSIDGGKGMEMDVPVGSYTEIIGKILQFGADAEAVSPKEFRELWLETIDSMQKRFIRQQ